MRIYLGVVNIDRISSTGNSEDRRIVKERREFCGIQCGRADEEFQIWTKSGNILQKYRIFSKNL